MVAGLERMVVLMPALFLANKVDWTVSENVMMLRVAFFGVQIAAVALCALLYFRVKGSHHRGTVTVPAVSQWGVPDTTSTPTTMSVPEYDMTQFHKLVKQQILPGAVVLSLFHFYAGAVTPLFIQCFMTPISLYGNPLFKIYFLGYTGDAVSRPFKEESPFPTMTPPDQQQEAQPASEESNSETTQADNAEEKKKKKKKQKKHKKQEDKEEEEQKEEEEEEQKKEEEEEQKEEEDNKEERTNKKENEEKEEKKEEASKKRSKKSRKVD